MSYLMKSRCYLSGPIEADTSKTNWRIPVKDVLVKEFGIDLFDPFEDPKQQCLAQLKNAKDNEDYDVLCDIAKRFVRKDLCMVDRSDFLIANLPKGVLTTGSCHEIINSNNAKKPTLIVCENGKKFIPAWYFGFIPHECMFGSWDDLYDYLRKVNEGKYKEDDRWSYIYKLI